MALAVSAYSSIDPANVSRDRVDYSSHMIFPYPDLLL